MKCSSCSEQVKPIVAIDIDGTLGDYHGHFVNFASMYLQEEVDGSEYDGTLEFSEALGLDKGMYRQIKLAYRQGGMKRSMPDLENPSAFMRELVSMGFEIWITTTRPWMRLDNIDPDTRFWLQTRGIPFNALLYDQDKYSVLVSNVQQERIVAVVDDLSEQIMAANSLGIPTIHRKTKWNRGVEHFGYASLSDIKNELADMLFMWNKVNK